MNGSRLGNSLKNLGSGFAARIVTLLLGLVVRTVFIRTLGNDYLSVNGLYSNILSMLSLAELGFGTAVVYSMYKPLAERDDETLAALMTLYKKAYRVIGAVVLVLGLCVIPFLDLIIKDPPDIPYLTLYYVMFLLNTTMSYWFFSYKRSILTADQKEYVCTNYRTIFATIRSAVQFILLLVFRLFFLYLLTQILFTVVENLWVAIVAGKRYPALHIAKPRRLTKAETSRISKDVKGLMLSRVAHVILNSTDNIIISAFVGISWVGLLSNFTLITDTVTGVLCQITSALSASLGNYFVEKSKDEGYRLFERVEFMNSWLYGFCAVCLLMLLNPFVTLWLGAEFTLSDAVIAAMCLNFFVQGYMNTLWTFRSSLGLFTQGWYRPLIVAVLNIGLSILLGIRWGVFGVLIATSMSRMLVNVWFDPLIIHKYGFQRSVLPFFKSYLLRILEVGIAIVLLIGLRPLILNSGITILSFVCLCVVTVIVFAGVFWITQHKSEDYDYFIGILKTRILHRMSK